MSQMSDGDPPLVAPLSATCQADVTKPKRRRRTVPPKRKLQSLSQLDQRTALARAARELQGELTVALGGDLPPQKRLLVTRVALLDAFCSACEARWLLAGDAIDPSYAGCVSQLRRTLESLGLERRARVIANPIQVEFDRREAERLANLPEPIETYTDAQHAADWERDNRIIEQHRLEDERLKSTKEAAP